eukprot:scaffold2822_cov100-Isochrysis_galbana.AAC.12
MAVIAGAQSRTALCQLGEPTTYVTECTAHTSNVGGGEGGRAHLLAAKVGSDPITAETNPSRRLLELDAGSLRSCAARPIPNLNQNLFQCKQEASCCGHGAPQPREPPLSAAAHEDCNQFTPLRFARHLDRIRALVRPRQPL